ncbi:MAG: hypothetical protein ABI634_14005 [Acidobacteriota bacterium]
MDSQTAEPVASSAEDFRRANVWWFTAGPGLRIKCRHLSFDDMLYLGVISTPILRELASAFKPDTSMAQAFASDEKREQLIAIARRYAAEVALEPRISLVPSDDPTVLVLAGVPDLTDATVVRLMNDGAGRRLGVDLSAHGMFRPVERAVAPVDRQDGVEVRAETERVADAPVQPTDGAE